MLHKPFLFPGCRWRTCEHFHHFQKGFSGLLSMSLPPAPFCKYIVISRATLQMKARCGSYSDEQIYGFHFSSTSHGIRPHPSHPSSPIFFCWDRWKCPSTFFWKFPCLWGTQPGLHINHGPAHAHRMHMFSNLASLLGWGHSGSRHLHQR